MRRFLPALATLMAMLLLLTPLLFPKPSQAVPSISPPTFNITGMNNSMKNTYVWAVSRTLSNGTATLTGTSNNLLSTSLVGRVLTYDHLEIGNSTSLALIKKMINAEHILLQNPRYISFGIWPVQDHLTQLRIHRDVQKFLLRAYGLTLNQTARSDFVKVTQDIYLNMPGKFEYFDTIAWGFANSVWFAFYNRSPLPPSSDFTSAVQDLNLHYNLTAAEADSANPLVDFSRLLHYLSGPEYTDSYFRLEGNSLDQTHHDLEAQLANQLIRRQLPNGNITRAPFIHNKPTSYEAYLVEDYARDLDSAYYLNNNVTYVYSAFRAESFLTSLYLQPNGNISLPNSGESYDPIIAFHLTSIANDIKLSSTTDWYSALSQASKIINHTMSIQSPDGTFNFHTNSTNPGSAYTTISSVSTIVDSYVLLRNSNVLVTGSSSTSASSVSVSSTSGTSSGSSATTSRGISGSTDTISRIIQSVSSSSGSVSGNGQPPQSNLSATLPSQIPSWVYIVIPIFLLIAIAIVYEARHRARYHGLVDK